MGGVWWADQDPPFPCVMVEGLAALSDDGEESGGT
jgi:hypothetical protein